jgi:hypothetical protein
VDAEEASAEGERPGGGEAPVRRVLVRLDEFGETLPQADPELVETVAPLERGVLGEEVQPRPPPDVPGTARPVGRVVMNSFVCK